MSERAIRTVILLLLAMTLCGGAVAQTSSSDAQSQVQAFLASHPEVVDQLKELLAKQLQQQGSAIDPQAITDAVLAARLQSDPTFRETAVRYMVEQGTISESQGRELTQRFASSSGGTMGTTTAQAAQPQPGEAAQLGETIQPSEAIQPGEVTPTVEGTSPRAEAGAPSTTTRTAARASQPEQRFDDSVLNPQTVPQKNPYPSLPSTAALYLQFPDDVKGLKRFGSDIFRPDVVGLSQFPMDLPAGPEYVLGPGDNLTLDIWGGYSQKLVRIVDREGRVSLPEAGPVVVAGLSVAQAQKVIQAKLEPQFHNANVDVSVTRVRTVRIYVVGDVQRPGAYDISALSTPLNALYAAGGPTPTGSLRVVKHMRGSRVLGQMDLYDLLLRGVRQGIEHLEPGDTILVPPVGPLVAVSGSVRRPAIYELLADTQLADVLEMAGGVPVSASMDNIKVERIEAHQKRVLLNVKLAGGSTEMPLSQMVGPFWVKDGDRVSVLPILPYSDRIIYLQGHVYHPGSFAYRDGMQVTDLLHSYQDILPEPATHAEIIRLQPPDFRPVTIEFNLASALAGDSTVTLQQFDTVRVYGRYEVDAPRVAVYGDVLRPGEYPMSAGMTAAGLVQMAGGFKRSAFRDSASLASYVVENGQKVSTDQQTVRIGAAFAGEASADVRLKPGDVLTILQIPGWRDIGRSVTIRGEVEYPGNYGINEGERISAFLKRVGGFTNSAYPAGIVLEREDVRKIEEQGRQELIHRLETSGAAIQVSPNTTGKDQADVLQAVQAQQKQAVASLRNQPATGRLVLTISGDISQWENTPSDIQLRSGDSITVPKLPNFVLSYGQVYNANALTYKPGKTAGWYLKQAGGPTQLANKKGIYVIRANGSVVSSGGTSDLFSGGVMNTKMQPGDVLVVPEKFVTGSSAWQTTLATASFLASLAIAAAAVAHL
ncbi:MAG TPA: SLBB domain-containing protein [Candidatus Angelobacter sp.]|nr:SLBB domain-containing protein [Candidatus Angelobacter sp.]